MSIIKGGQTIANSSWVIKNNFKYLLEPFWSDYILNIENCLRADTFSWHDGSVYSSAYSHLVGDLLEATEETETIGSTTITYYKAVDGHKICLPDEISNIETIYLTTGVAWYYVVDSENVQFKLPRTKYGFNGFRTEVGKFIDESLPNIKGRSGYMYTYDASGQWNGALRTQTGGGGVATGSGTLTACAPTEFDASHSSSIYQDNAPVQPKATEMYLYFYVGEFTQTATQQTAGITSETLNNKADLDLSNVTASHIIETYVNGTNGYRIWSDGFCEQWGNISAVPGRQTVTLLKTCRDGYARVYISCAHVGFAAASTISAGLANESTVDINNSTSYNMTCNWLVKGYLAEGQY